MKIEENPSQELVNVVVAGDVIEGKNLEEVLLQLASVFKVEVETIRYFFGKGPKEVKRNVSRSEGERYIRIFEQVGVEASLIDAVENPSQELVNVVVAGDVIEGKNLEEVLLQLASVFKVNVETVRYFFGKGPKEVKRNVSRSEGERYIKIFQQVGVEASLIDVVETQIPKLSRNDSVTNSDSTLKEIPQFGAIQQKNQDNYELKKENSETASTGGISATANHPEKPYLNRQQILPKKRVFLTGNKIAILIAIIVVSFFAYVGAGPYLTLSAIKSSITHNDEEALSEYIDFNSLRQNIKDQLHQAVLVKVGQDLKGNPFSGIAEEIAKKQLDSRVDAFVTPSGLTSLMGGKSNEVDQNGDSDKSGIDIPIFKDARYSYDSNDKFSIYVRNKNEGEVRFIMRRDGLSWRIVNLDLQGSVFSIFSDSTEKTNTARTQIENLSSTLDIYRLENGRYPTTKQGLDSLVANKSGSKTWNGPYLNKKVIPKDPWGFEYKYESPGTHGSFDLYSLGADNLIGGEGENQDVLGWELKK